MFESRPGLPNASGLQFFAYLNDLQQSQLIFKHATPPSGNQALVSFMSPPAPQSPVRIETWQIFDPRQSRAYFAVVALGEKCLPTLVRRLQTRDNAITRGMQKVRDWAIKQHLMRAGSVRPPPDVRRGQAALAIVQLGDVSKPILPRVVALAKINHDPGIRKSALDVLRCLSPTDYAQVTRQTNIVNAVAR